MTDAQIDLASRDWKIMYCGHFIPKDHAVVSLGKNRKRKHWEVSMLNKILVSDKHIECY